MYSFDPPGLGRFFSGGSRNVLIVYIHSGSFFPAHSKLSGWSLRGAVATDHGELLGNNSGVQLTIGHDMNIHFKKKR